MELQICDLCYDIRGDIFKSDLGILCVSCVSNYVELHDKDILPRKKMHNVSMIFEHPEKQYFIYSSSSPYQLKVRILKDKLSFQKNMVKTTKEYLKHIQKDKPKPKPKTPKQPTITITTTITDNDNNN